VQPNVIDLDGAAASSSSQSKSPRKRTNSKADAKHQASSQAIMDTIKIFLAKKEVSSEKRDERKCRDKEEVVKTTVTFKTRSSKFKR
jgi:hypothetical protein